MIVVTGGAGFIGSNLIKKLNQQSHEKILVVDDLTDGRRFTNLVDCKFYDYCDKDDFIQKIIQRKISEKITVIFHQGACSDTTEWNGRYMMQNNYDYSKFLLHFATEQTIPFIYASSAAIYGDGKNGFNEQDNNCEKPLNVYGYSKYLFDQYVRRVLPETKSQIVGLRYFNVYGPREQHKGKMASVAYHFHNQLVQTGVMKLFVGSGGYQNGEQRRDFIYVEDVVNVITWFWKNPEKSGIYNVGTGKSQTFNDVAHAVMNWHNRGKIEYIPFPENLQNAYQSFTEADISQLRLIGYENPMSNVAEGIKKYLNCMIKS